MLSFAIGVTIVAVGVLFLVWTGVYNNRRTTDPIREELSREADSNRNAEQSIIGAKSTLESISDELKREDSSIKQSINDISGTVENISGREQEDSEIFEQIRKQKLDK